MVELALCLRFLEESERLVKHFKLLLLLLMARFLVGMGVDLYAPSLPHIVQYFQSSRHTVQFTIGSYLLGYGIGPIILGLLSDNLGRRKIMLFSAALFTGISVLSIFSPDVSWLIFYRFLQGIATGSMSVNCRAIASDYFEGIEFNKAMNYLATSWTLGPIIGPIIGGYLQHYFHWQANFYFFTAYGLVLLVYMLLYLPETNHQLQPLQPIRIFTTIKKVLSHPVFICGSLIPILIYASVATFNTVGPFIIQNTLHYSAIVYGHVAFGLGLACLVGTVINRLLSAKFTPVQLVGIGIIGACFFSVLMLLVGLWLPLGLYTISIPVWCIFCAGAFVMPNMAVQCVRLFPKNAATASAVYGSIAASGAFLLVSLSTLLHPKTQVPLAGMYVCMMFVGVLLFWGYTKLLHNANNS